jgi:NRAMP (natural resistance-associated macrophage protein)-like metal ion transporter
MKWKDLLGPSTLVTAAFIGPGTVTMCTLAGATNGYSLLWAMVFSICATIVLQEMSARIGLITQKGLGHAIRTEAGSGIKKYILFFLVISGILIGNAAYEAGNISGGILGLELFFPMRLWPLILGLFCFVLLFWGKYKLIEKLLISLVIIISLCFIITAILIQPSLSEILSGFVPRSVEPKEILLIIGLIGTTVVPYNLFLHASIVSEKWKSPEDLSKVRIENRVAILLGGIISILIIIVAAGMHERQIEISSAADMAIQLEPLLGNYAKFFMAMGLFAAGITSAITAPLAAAYAARGLFGWDKNNKDIKFRAVWIIILGIGVSFASLGIKPILIIKFAQVTNGILLPVIAGYILYLVNKKSLLKNYTNNTFQNITGIIVILITLALSFRTLYTLFFV